MSTVTDILLHTSLNDGFIFDRGTPNADLFSAWLVKTYGPANALTKVNKYFGGGKAFQADIFGVAINGCDTENIVAAFKAIEWEFPENAQLFIKCENDDKFTIYNAED